MKKFVCSVCGYVHEGDEAPQNSVQFAKLPRKNSKNRQVKKYGLQSTL